MAPPSPRRSSRARPTISQSQQSSVSSGTSGLPDRNARPVNRPASGKSTPSASLSSEPLDDLDDTLLGRRRKRGLDDDQEKISLPEPTNMINGIEYLQDEEDEAVRCICGSDDYPGPPPPDAPEAEFFLQHELTEDVTGFFVQCDICKVWQHGACVGIFSAESSPDEYFCEQCRKEFHHIYTADNGFKYSKYLPLHRSSRATSQATSLAKDGTLSPRPNGSKSSRPPSNSNSSKRRSTMNSRDAAYDDEQLRRAIEASREEVAGESSENAAGRTKRGRSDSDSNLSGVKRQRTSSRSISPALELEPEPQPPANDDSDDELNTRNGSKKARNGRTQRDLREKEEKEEKERVRQEAANKRKGRAERRRAEDSELSEEIPVAASKPVIAKSVEPPTILEPVAPVQLAPGTPPSIATIGGSNHKRVRSSHKKSKGKNQYTKDRDDVEESPARSMSRDIQKMDDPPVPVHSKSSSVDQRSSSKSKPAGSTRMSMLDMKRRVAAIMEFISRTQVDLATEALPGQNGELVVADADFSGQPSVNGGSEKQLEAEADTDFKDMNCLEMMDVLTRDMVKWQNQYS